MSSSPSRPAPEVRAQRPAWRMSRGLLPSDLQFTPAFESRVSRTFSTKPMPRKEGPMVAGSRRHGLATLVTWHLAIYSTNTHQVSLRALPVLPAEAISLKGVGSISPTFPTGTQARSGSAASDSEWHREGGCWLRLVSVLSTSRGDGTGACARATPDRGRRLPCAPGIQA